MPDEPPRLPDGWRHHAALLRVSAPLLFTTVAFPEYFNELTALNRQMLTAQGKSAAEIDAALNAAAPMQTPLANALAGWFGTLITGAIASAIIAFWVRAVPPEPGKR